jgi:hypothetical protein
MRIRGLTTGTLLRLLMPRNALACDPPRKIFLCIADHYEPMLNGAPMSVQHDRVDRWVDLYPRFEQYRDSAGRPPQHTFFYPAEEYNESHIAKLETLCRRGFGDFEVHLHHDNDTPDRLRTTILEFTDKLYRRHGLLRKEADGRISYAFIHGNWALCNSRPDGRWCGVNDEISTLVETGCYADMTMPSAPSPTQTSTINSIYYAMSRPDRPKGHDQGIRAAVGATRPSDHLLMIQGPLALDWQSRKRGLLPGIENADLHGGRPPTISRLKLWLKARVHVAGRPDWVFIKLHTHGAKEANAEMLLGEAMHHFHRELARFAREKGAGFEYFYVTARELVGLVHEAESVAAEAQNPVRTKGAVAWHSES